MADWPPVAPVKPSLSPREKEKTYLQLVDMFVDIVDPDIIQMVLQNHNWDVDAALEDIMTLANSSQPDSTQNFNKTSNTSKVPNPPKVKKDSTGPQNKNVPMSQFPPSYSPQDREQKQPKKQMPPKPFQYKTTDAKIDNQIQLPQFLEQYNYVKALRNPFDRAVMLIKDGVKVMIILRGPPGCGKSFLARRLLLECGETSPAALKRHVFSTDEFFIKNNVYVFVPELLGQAHLWNQRSVAAAIRDEVSPVIVDNTNTQSWEMQVYVEMAVSAGYDLEILEPETGWFNREGELAKRNVHGVPRAKIRLMLERYERNITPDRLMKQFGLRYQLTKSPPQPVRNCKWRDKLSNQRNNKPKKKKNDFSSKSQGNLDNINSTFQSLNINSPTSSNLQNEFMTMNSRATNLFPPQIGCNNKITTDGESNLFLKEEKAKEESKKFYMNGDSCHLTMKSNAVEINCQRPLFGEPDTNKLFDDLVRSSGSFLNSLSAVSKSSSDPNKVPEPSSDIFFAETFNGQGKDSFFSTLNRQSTQVQLPQLCPDPSQSNLNGHSKDPFDFLAETKKLIDALNRPSTQAQLPNLVPDPSQSNLEKETAESVNVNDVLECDKNKGFLAREQNPNEMTYSDQTSYIEKECHSRFEDKVEVAHDLIDLIIEKAISSTNSLQPDCSNVELEVEGDNGQSAIYNPSVVNQDETFAHEWRGPIPLPWHPLPVSIADNTRLSACFTSGNSSADKTDYQIELRDVNIETYLSDVESDCNSTSKDHFESNSKIKLCDGNIEDLALDSCLHSENYEKHHDLLSFDCLAVDSHYTLMDKKDVSCLNTENKHDEKSGGTREHLVEANSNCNTPNVIEMMSDILCSLGPLNDNYNNLSGDNAESVLSETKISNISQDTTLSPPSVDKCTNISSDGVVDSTADWNVGNTWDSKGNHCNEESQPKPPRGLKRESSLRNSIKGRFNENDYSKYFGNWDSVSNPAETWGMVNEVTTKNVSDVLPQRSSIHRTRNNENMTDASTNTNYLDFSLVCDENLSDVKVLIGNINNIFPENVPEIRQNIVETLFLDKSTMTSDESTTSAVGYDITQIKSLFPNIPEKYILDMVERCQGDIDWAVDVLLDSEHIIAPVSVESNKDSSSTCNNKLKPDSRQIELISSIKKVREIPNREPKVPTQEQTDLKKLIESSVVFDKSHYSDKVLKVMKRKHPEYVHLKENSPPLEDKVLDTLEAADGLQDEYKTEDEVDEVEEESSSSGCEVETEDDTMDLVMSTDLILQLQQKFGSSSLPKIADITPIVKMPLSFARQLFGYIMDSLQSDMDEQQSLIEDMIAKDEEVARLLQDQDRDQRPQLQELMDMEIALAIHKAEQKEWNEKGNDTLAAKLSKNILLEKFPQVDPNMLEEVLQAHNNSLSDTIESLTVGLGVDPAPSTSSPSTSASAPPKEEKERVTSIIVSDDVGTAGAAAVNPVTQAEAHRAQAASYYDLRMECLSKAHEAFRSGNKTVATYYSQLAQIHKERMEQSNSKAAACLFSSHKTGANTLDLHFLHIREAEVVLDMFLDEVVSYISERNKRHQTVFLITGRGLRSVGGVSRIKPMVQRKLQGRGIPYNEVNPGMLSALVRNVTPLSYTL